MLTPLTALAALLPNVAPSPRAQNACTRAHVVTQPARPRGGALFRVRVSGAPDGATLVGTAAGEPLHFTRLTRDPTVYEALGAAPIDSIAPLRIALTCTVASGADSILATVQPTAADYPVERLVVAPQFSAPPDAALAARQAREAALAGDVSRRAHDTPQLWTAPFQRPRASRVTSTFGRGREFNGTITSRHMGTDYAGAVGAPVRAANRGVVRLVERFFLGGNVVYVDHGAGVVTAYLHLSAQTVAVGDTVERGRVIGKVGATGRVTGPHLHWIVRYGAVTVDPASLLAVTAASETPATR